MGRVVVKALLLRVLASLALPASLASRVVLWEAGIASHGRVFVPVSDITRDRIAIL